MNVFKEFEFIHPFNIFHSSFQKRPHEKNKKTLRCAMQICPIHSDGKKEIPDMADRTHWKTVRFARDSRSFDIDLSTTTTPFFPVGNLPPSDPTIPPANIFILCR